MKNLTDLLSCFEDFIETNGFEKCFRGGSNPGFYIDTGLQDIIQKSEQLKNKVLDSTLISKRINSPNYYSDNSLNYPSRIISRYDFCHGPNLINVYTPLHLF